MEGGALMATVLLCDDESLLRKVMKDFLEKAGYQVIEAEDGVDGLEKYQANKTTISLAILDVMMPRMDGFTLCQKIKAEDEQIPIIILTAKNDEEDELNSFEMGADDFIPKPLRPSIVVARVEAMLKRNKKFLESEETVLMMTEELIVNIESHQVQVNGKNVHLSKKEYELLLLLWNYRNQILTRDQILDNVWGLDSFVTDRTVDTHITRLRNKLSLENECIQTVRGYGYTLGNE